VYLSSLFCSLDLSVTRLSATAEEKRAKDLADDLKVLNKVARTRRNDLVGNRTGEGRPCLGPIN
jgi:hypothetical protein